MAHHPRNPTLRTHPSTRGCGRGRGARWGAWACAGVILSGLVGCATFRSDPGEPLVPTRYQTRIGPFALFTSTPIAPESPPVRCLSSLERDVSATLGLKVPAGEGPVEVYILRDREAFSHFLTFYYPELPPRRAFFIAQGQRQVVYTYQNSRLDEDLRHEATHALLHLAVGDLPLWLDEGLAEFFEGPDGRKGLNPEHLARLPDDLKAGWRPDLARLETLKSVREMTPRDYREAWAWVHYLLTGPGSGKAELLAYIGLLRQSASPPASLSERLTSLDPGASQRLLAHIEQVRSAPASSPLATKPVQKEPTILLQDAALDPASRSTSAAPAPRRSFFKSVLGWFGMGGRSQ